MTARSQPMFDQLEPLLAHVNKPIQYVGGELNAVTKPWDAVGVHWVLMYPDAYEVGQPNQGNAILYEVLNECDWVLAERTFSVWPDLEKLMRAAGLPLLSLETHRPVRAFDVLGVSLATELGYTNLLNALDLAGIALRIHVQIEAVRNATEEEVGRGTAGTGFFRIEPQAPGNDTVH